MNIREILLVAVFGGLCNMFFMSCVSNNSQNVADIESVIEKDIDLQLCDFAINMRLIALETGEACILGKTVSILYIGKEGIFVLSDNNVRRFDSNGRYICDIGVTGNGYGEHGNVLSCAYNDVTNEVLMCCFDNTIYKYGIDGTFKERMRLQVDEGETVRSIIAAKDGGCWGVGSRYDNSGISLRLCHFTSDGKRDVATVIYADGNSVNVSRESFPLLWKHNGTKSVKLEYDESIYIYDDKLEKQTFNLCLGSLAPDRTDVEDMENKSRLMKKKCQMLNVMETDLHYFLTAIYKMQYHLIIVNKATGDIVFNKTSENPKVGGGFVVGKTGSISIWPTYCNGEYAAGLLFPDKMTSDNKMQLACKYGVSVKKGDNPIVFMFKDS